MTKVEVTRKHINEGVQRNCNSCPIALAIKGVVKDDVDVSVGWLKMALSLGNYDRELWSPTEAMQFARRYDNGHDVHPITLELDIPERFLKETA